MSNSPVQTSFLTEDDGQLPEPPEFKKVFKLLQEVTTLGVISSYLKEKRITHSAGSWEELEKKRLLPHLAAGKLTMDELVKILCEAEEFGASNIFLFGIKKEIAVQLMDEERVKKIVQQRGWTDALGMGKMLDRPEAPTISSIRWETDPRGKSLVIKIIQKRWEKEFIGESTVGNRFKKEWDVVEVRAVSIVRLFSFGLLEIRTASHWYSTKYSDDIALIRTLVEPILPRTDFHEYSLTKAKTTLWENKKSFKDKIRFSSQCVRTDIGGRLDAAGGDEDGDMLEDPGISAGVDAVMKKGAFCESSRLYWLASETGGLPSRETHMILSGQKNEFAITVDSTKQDYEWVFDQLRALT